MQGCCSEACREDRLHPASEKRVPATHSHHRKVRPRLPAPPAPGRA
jgi:hypothetical protein